MSGWADTDDGFVSGVEAALLVRMRPEDVDVRIDQVLVRAVSSGLSEVLVRAGRIDAVYGVGKMDGRRLLLKVHRRPVHLGSRRLTVTTQHVLSGSGFTCAAPVAGPLLLDGQVVSVEALLEEGQLASGHDPGVRTSIRRAC